MDMNALREAAARRGRSSGTVSTSTLPPAPPRRSNKLFWLVLLVGLAWFFFGRTSSKPADVPRPAPTLAPAPVSVLAPVHAPATADHTQAQATAAGVPSGEVLDTSASPMTSASAAPESETTSTALPDPSDSKPQQAAKSLSFEEFIRAVSSSNRSSIERVLSIAADTADRALIEVAAREAGRQFNFGDWNISRDRKLARSMHDPVRERLNEPADVSEVCSMLTKAFVADPLDSEVTGNLAICQLRQANIEGAQNLALYALSLPRPINRTGRTADWVTLAATYAASGDAQKAKRALFVSLGITPDVARRCFSAVYSVKNTYGPVLKEATEAMLERIQERGLSDAVECRLPVNW